MALPGADSCSIQNAASDFHCSGTKTKPHAVHSCDLSVTSMEREHASFPICNHLWKLKLQPATALRINLPPASDIWQSQRWRMMISVLTNSAPQHAGCTNQSNHQKYGVLPWRIGRQGDLRLLLITDRNSNTGVCRRASQVKGKPLCYLSPLMLSRKPASSAKSIRNPSPALAFQGPAVMKPALFIV